MPYADPPQSQAPPPKRRREKSEVRRAAILAAALGEFRKKGFAAARMEDIAQQAHVSKGTIYLYFSDKKALFQGVIESGFAPFFERNEQIMRDASLPLREKLLRMYAPLTEVDARSPLRSVLCLVYSEGLHDPELVTEFYRAFLAPYAAHLRRELLAATYPCRIHEALSAFPQLLVAPVLFGVMYKELFGNVIPLDLQGLFAAHLNILFPTQNGNAVTPGTCDVSRPEHPAKNR